MQLNASGFLAEWNAVIFARLLGPQYSQVLEQSFVGMISENFTFESPVGEILAAPT